MRPAALKREAQRTSNPLRPSGCSSCTSSSSTCARRDPVDRTEPRLDRFGRALEHRLDRAIGSVADPARRRRGARPRSRVESRKNTPCTRPCTTHRLRITSSCMHAILQQALPSATRAMLDACMRIFLLIGLLAGAAAVAVVLRPRLRSLTAEAARAGELERELVACARTSSTSGRAAEERLATVNDAQERLSDSFKALSAEALQSSMAQLTELARAQLDAAQAEAKGDLDKRQQAVEQLVAPLKEQLGRVDQQLLRLDQERRESRGRLEAQLRTLTETGEKLRTETGALVTALRKPNTRGQWGQMQLRNVVELAGMVRHCDFVEQSRWPATRPTLRPDLIVACPGASTSWSTPRRRSRACSTPTRPATRTSASATCATTPGCCASTSRRWPTRRTGTGSTRRRTSSSCSCPASTCTAPRSRPTRRCSRTRWRGGC